MQSTGHFHRESGGHRTQHMQESPSRPNNTAIGVGAAFSGALLFIRAKHERLGFDGLWGETSTTWERLPILLFVVVIFRLQNVVNSSVKQLATVSSRSITMMLQRSAVSSTNLRHSLSSSEALLRLSRVSSSVSSSICEKLKAYRRRSVLKAITRKECFAKKEYIERLSIHDFIILFRYANEVNQSGFQKKNFMTKQPQLVRSMITAMEMAVNMSRGVQRQGIKIRHDRRRGDIDALYFTAVGRIFAEWRMIRLVPKGYGRYAAGLNMAYRDVLQNLAKIEAGVHAYLEQTGGRPNEEGSLSPTLREIIEFEREMNVHPRLPKVSEKSAASGILWTKRQLDYQACIFSNMLHIPIEFETMQAAGKAAYTQVYGDYHGWALKQLFSQSFGGSPPVDAILSQMNPATDDRGFTASPGIQRRISDVSSGSSEIADNEFLVALDGFGIFMGNKWDDIMRLFNCVDNKNRGKSSQNVFISSESYLDMKNVNASPHVPTISGSVSDDSDDTPMACDPLEDVSQGVIQFVNELRPLLEDITGLLEEKNMNDPTKV